MTKRVLVVEDDLLNRMYLCAVLEGNGFVADSVSDGAHVLETARRVRPDVITMDINLPHISGLELIKRLVETAADFAIEILAPGGAFVAKVLAGGTDTALLALLKTHFASVKHAKPPASRKDSSEWYVIAKGFKGARP